MTALRNAGALRWLPALGRSTLLVAAVAVGIGVSAGLGHLAGSGHGEQLLLLAAGLALTACAFRWPLFGAVVAVVAVASFFDQSALPAVGAGGLEVRAGEIVAVVATLGAVNRADPAKLRALWVPLSLLGGFVVLSWLATVYAVATGFVTLPDAAQDFRSIVQLGLVLVIGLVADARGLRRLLDSLLVVGAAVGVFAVAASAVPAAASLANTMATNAAVPPDDAQGVGSLLRVRMPGLALCYALLLPGVGVLLAERGWRNWLRSAALISMLAAIVVSFNRNQWVGSLLGLAIVVLVGSPEFRGRLLRSAVPVALVGVIAVSALFGKSDAAIAVMERFDSLVNGTPVTQTGSVRIREVESGLALAAIRDSPLLGIGPGVGYGNITRYGDRLTDATSVHNQYLQIALQYGIPALLVFLGGVAACLSAGIRARSRPPRLHAYVATMAVGAVIAILASSVVAMYILPANALAALSVCLGLLIARPSPAEP
jgi:O-antigen ligase